MALTTVSIHHVITAINGRLLAFARCLVNGISFNTIATVLVVVETLFAILDFTGYARLNSCEWLVVYILA